MSFLQPKAPSLPPPVTREDPAIAERKKTVRQAELKRRGRRASVLAPPEDQLGAAPVVRPTTGTLG